jgi:diguanylate cyclase (GGDEF)-like protein
MRPSESHSTSSVSTPRRHYAALVALAVVYYAAAALGLRLAYLHPSATPVWAPTGIALAALLLWGRSVWPAIFAGAFLVNLATEGNVATSAGIALGNTLEGVLGAYLVRRTSRGAHMFDDARDVFRFVMLAGVLSTMVSATIGVSVLSLGGFAPWAEFRSIWLTWWLGDVAGALVVAPALITWAHHRRLQWPEDRPLEAIGLLVVLMVVGQIVFGGVVPSWGAPLPLEFLSLPLLLWAGVRFAPREAATTTLLLSGIAVRGTLHGLGPFMRVGANDSLLLAQSFMVVSAASTLVLAAVVAERRRATKQLQHLSESDGLTGLANYRRLQEVLAHEIQRYGRTPRSFALLLMDLNELKSINDRFGHVAGNRAICRVGEAMRACCRAVDTPARFGGDEFAVVLPETDIAEALAVADRIQERVQSSGEEPPLLLSFGVSSYPTDGATPEALIEHADRVLYTMKRAPRRRPGEGITAHPR